MGTAAGPVVSDTPPPPDDPLGAMRHAYDEALEVWSRAMEQMVGSEEFASASGRFLSRYVEMQEAMRVASRASAESLHLPTRDDLASLAQLVINVERKVDEVADAAHAITGRLASLEARLDALAGPRAAPKPAPARRRAKPAAKQPG